MEVEYQTTPPYDDTILEPPQEEPLISLHDLSSLSAPQTLKLIGYIKTNR
jgi:hypothetical protein